MAKTSTRRINIYINGKEVEATIKSIRSEMNRLINEQNRMIIGSNEYIAHAKKIQELRGYLYEHSQSIASVANSWEKFQKKMMVFGAGLGGFTQLFSAVNAVVGTLKQTATDLAALDDIYADVIKTTNLTREQVEHLNDSFKKMDTRTSREQLNNLAYIAGKLGISTEELVKQFVEASDILNISMGDVLGDDATLAIGKMVGVYERSSEILKGLNLKERMLSLGAAVNDIATGDLYIQKATATIYSCGLVINPFPIDFSEKKLSENDYGEDIIISRSSVEHRLKWLQFLYSSLSEKSIYKFPLFIDTAFYGSANKDFGWFLLPSDTPAGNQSGFQASINTNDTAGLDRCYLNRLFTDMYGNVIEVLSNSNRGIRVFNNTTANNPNSFAFAPAIQLLWILQKTVQNAGYQITGNFQTEAAIQKIYSQSLRALDGLASQFDNAVAKTTATISQPVSFSDIPEDNLILPFEIDNQKHYYFRASSAGIHQISVSITTYLPANLLGAGIHPEDSGMTYKEAVIFFMIEEWNDFPDWLFGAASENWNNGIGYMSGGNYTPFGCFFKVYTLNLLQSQIGYTGAGFYTFNFNFSQSLAANRNYKFFFGKVRGSIFNEATMFDNYQNITVTQDISAFYNICNIFANRLRFAEHVPALTNSDFINNICNCFGLCMFIDSAKGQIEFSFFKDILAHAQAIDLSYCLLNKKTFIEKNDFKKYRYKLEAISNEDIDETKLLSPVRSYTQLPNAVTNYGKICFVENENRYHTAVRVGDAVQNWVFKWSPYTGNNQVLEIGEGESEDITPQFKIPNMKIAEEKMYNNSHFLLNIETQGCSPVFDTGNKEFDMVLINYRGHKKLNQSSICYEHASPVCMDRNGNTEQGISLTATGENSIGEIYAAPWLAFLASYERVCHTFSLSVSMFMEILQLLKPQDVPPNRQTRFVLIDSVKLLPIKMTFQFTEGSSYIIAEIVFAKEWGEL